MSNTCRNAGLKEYWKGYRIADYNIYTYGFDDAKKMSTSSTISLTQEKGYLRKIKNYKKKYI